MEHQALPPRVPARVPARVPPRVRSQAKDAILDAALACVARVGIGKTTLDDVAREAGCARATVYRHFPGKQQLLLAVLRREVDALTASVTTAADAEVDLAGAAAAAITTAAEVLVGHEALRVVLTVEPEVLLPHISFANGDVLLAAASVRLAPAFARFLAEDRARRLSEWLVRICLSYLCSPEASDLLDRERVRALVESFVLPGLTRDVPSEGIHA
jgi:AcrR family transcriptional regulator